MDTLPRELLEQILLLLPPASQFRARLTCKVFDGVLSHHILATLRNFMSLKDARKQLEIAVRKIPPGSTSRPVTIAGHTQAFWVTDLNIQDGFLMGLYHAAMGEFYDPKTQGMMSVDKFGKLIGRPDLTAGMLWSLQDKYVLYLAHMNFQASEHYPMGTAQVEDRVLHQSDNDLPEKYLDISTWEALAYAFESSPHLKDEMGSNVQDNAAI